MQLVNAFATSMFLVSFCVSCSGGTSNNDNDSGNAVETKECPAAQPPSLPAGMSVSGEISSVKITYFCDGAQLKTDKQTNSVDTTMSNFQFNCTNPADENQSLAFWLIAPTVNSPFTVTFPWSEFNPNLTATFTNGDHFLKQDSFTHDQKNVESIVAVVYSLTKAASSVRLTGCLEGQFSQSETKQGGKFLATFDANF